MDLSNISYVGIVFVCILLSMTLHEAMHAFASHWLGDDTAKNEGRLTLNPLAHIDPITTILLPLTLALFHLPPFGAAKPVPFDPRRVRFGEYGAGLVALAGPLTNLVLAALVGVVLQSSFGQSMPALLQDVLGVFGLVNISFFAFNIIPFPPLDGSRVLFAIAPDSVRSVMATIESMGFMALILFMLLFYSFLLNPFTQLVVWLSAHLLGVSY